MAVVVIISGFGALNGWTMICAEMPLAAADDGLFPAQFKRMSKTGVPAFGIIASTVLASIAMAVNYLGSGGATVFTTLVLMTGITSAIPYGFSALAQLKWRWIDHRTMHTPRFIRDMIVAVLSLVFSVLFIWYSRNTGAQLLGLLGTVLPGRRRTGPRHPGLPGAAPPPDAACPSTALPVTQFRKAVRRHAAPNHQKTS